MNIVFLKCNSSNFKAGRIDNIKYIVVHYTGNNGDTAAGNAAYFANNKNLSASAHYFVDEYSTVYQSVKDTDTAWHCGAKTYKHKNCRNDNSIGIEMCCRKENGKYYFKEKTIENTQKLIKILMALYNISQENVIRHYDVTGKNCPAPFVEDAKAWANFKKIIEMGDKMPTFKDIKGHYAQKHIEKLVDYGIVNGYNDNTFRPNEPITRAQVAIIVANALSILGK